MGRYSYASNITAIRDAFQVSHADAGLVTTCFFFSYGAGQITNGILCRHYNKRYVIAAALVLSSVLNAAVFCDVPFACMKYLWLLNGAIQSVLWSSLIGILSETLESKDFAKAAVIMSITVPVGIFLVYGLSALLAVWGGWRYSFLGSAVIMTAVAVLWFAMYKRAFGRREKSCGREKTCKVQCKASRFLILMIIVMGILAAISNLVKDGLTKWVPSILKEKFGLHDSLSILLTLVLPLFGVFGAACDTIMNRKIKSFIMISGIWYLFTAAGIGVVMLFFKTDLWGVVLILFGCLSLFMHAVNSLVTSIAPMYMRDQIDSGLLAGLMNGCCYVGSTISSYVLGSVADAFGWNSVFGMLLLASCCAFILSAGFAFARRRRGKCNVI